MSFLRVAPLIISVAVAIFGGIASIIGFLEVIVIAVFAPELRGVFTMLLTIGVLILCAQGLFGREEA